MKSYFLPLVIILLNMSVSYSQTNTNSDTTAERNICFDVTKEDFQKSISYFEKMIEKGSLNLETRYNLAMSYYKLVNETDYKKSILHWDFIIGKDSCYNYALINRALCKYFTKDLAGACFDIKKAKNCNYPDKSDIEGYTNLFCKEKTE